MTAHPEVPITPDRIRAAVELTLAWGEATAGKDAIAAALAVARGAPDDLIEVVASGRRVVLSGAGSSYYICQVAASAMRQVAGIPAIAVPLSDLLLRPDDVLLADGQPDPVFLVSRSGSTTEAVEAMESLRRHGRYTVAVTARPASPLTELASATLSVAEADEEAIVMTRSVAALTTLLMRLAARVAGHPLGEALDQLPDRWHETAVHVSEAFELAAAAPSRVVVLGGGAAYGLANEAVLKLTETSRVPAAAYHPLEFRHGPISVCEPGMLVVGLLGGQAAAAERRVLDECRRLGATTWILGPDGPAADLGEIAQLPLVLHPLQALALGVAVGRGRDPDSPRHLGQVVVIEGV
jgi:glucosamine--fructose-6-phosphate aminotransferase (isomerizing)